MEDQGTYEIDSIPLSSLADRYKVGRTAMYDRLKALGIEPEKRGRLAYISGVQLHQMDELDTRLKAGELMPKPTAEHDRQTSLEYSPNLSTKHSPDSTALAPSTDSALLTIASMLQSLKEPTDPMANYRALQSAVDNGWLLPTSKVRELVGVKPHGAEFDRLGFRFIRSARRTEWKVTIAPR